VEVQDEPSQRDHMLEDFRPYCDHGYVKLCPKGVSPIMEYGDQFITIHQVSAMKKAGPLEALNIFII
jgi:hypothetical protein